MTEDKPLVSVIIPVYNCKSYLAEAIESALVQTYRSIEVIVVDDGSIDGSPDVARRFGALVKCIAQPHRGAGAARNRGVDIARGRFIAFLDADDVWVKDKLDRQVAAFNADSRLDLVFGYVRQFVSPELDESIRKGLRCPPEDMPGYVPGAMLVRRDAFLRVGPFETRWQVGELVDWYLKATELGLRSILLPDVVLHRRLHTTNLGIRERQSQVDYVRIVKTALDRRRRTDCEHGSS